MEILSQLFGGTSRVKIMRLFLFNEDKHFTTSDIALKTRLAKTTITRELRWLEKVGLVKKKEPPKNVKPKKKGKATARTTKKRQTRYLINHRFVYTETLKQLLALNDPVAHKDITDKLKRVGKLKLVIVTGIFIGRKTDKIDLLVVGDSLKKKEIERALLAIESDVGREIAYAYFDTHDFLYRVNVKDRLIRDILDYPHERIIDKLHASS